MSVCQEASAYWVKNSIFYCTTLIKTHYNCPRLKLGNGLVATEVPGHFQSTAEVPWSKVLNPQNAQSACQAQLTHSDLYLLMMHVFIVC